MKVILTIFFIVWFTILDAQIVVDTGNVLIEISSVIAAMPGDSGDDYLAPNQIQLQSWENAINNLLTGNYNQTSDTLNAIGYNLIAFTDTSEANSETYYILKTQTSNYWGTYVFNPNYCRELIIQSPHPQKDFNTGKQGIYVFKNTRALFYCLSGTNRCNNSTFSSCTGTTTVCSGSSESYRISDLAHNTNSIFQKTTEILFQFSSSTYFVQLHGFTKKSTDPYVILSNGTQITPTLDFMFIFKNKLLDEDGTLTFKVAHLDLSWTRLRGFYNTQGRLINGSSDFCNTNATTTDGRFFHMEQERTKLRKDTLGWAKVANALNNTFICSPVSVPVISFNTGMKLFPNPTSGMIFLEVNEMERNQVKIYTLLGQEVTGLVNIRKSGFRQVAINLEQLPVGSYIVRTETNFGIVFKL